MTSSGGIIEILLVEDSPSDARLTQEAFRDGKISNNLHHVLDGAAAMDFLQRKPGYEDKPRPDLVLLDLNLPKLDGREVLKRIKSDPALQTIPVVILSTSEAEQDIAKAYEFHANCYITKPVDLSRFLEIVSVIENFWLMVVKLPPTN